MFPVEVVLADEEKLARVMENMRTWRDHQRFEPVGFRYTFGAKTIVRVDFSREAEASSFATAFGGGIVAFPA